MESLKASAIERGLGLLETIAASRAGLGNVSSEEIAKVLTENPQLVAQLAQDPEILAAIAPVLATMPAEETNGTLTTEKEPG